jgi:hypothetical protein
MHGKRQRSPGLVRSALFATLFVISGIALTAPSAAACTSGPTQSPGGPNCGSTPVTVTILIPTSATGASLALVEFNGTLYPNGSVLQPLILGYNYTFSVVDIVPGYVFGHWAVSNGTIGSISSTTSTLSFACPNTQCPTVNVIIGLGAGNHALMSGEVYRANTASSIAASFAVPAGSWWNLPGGSPPGAGKTEVVNWGVGLGGLLSSPTLNLGVQVFDKSLGSNSFQITYQPFWATSFTTSGQTNFSLTPNSKVSLDDEINVQLDGASVSCIANYIYIAIHDVNTNSGYHSCVAAPTSPTTGQWMVWDPSNASGILSPSDQNEYFTNIVFNGKAVYPPVQIFSPPAPSPNPCSPWPLCQPSSLPTVDFIQWANAGGGWNESLVPGNLTYSWTPPSKFSGPGYFGPWVSTLANVGLLIFPYNGVTPSQPLEIVINSFAYQNGASANLPYDAESSIAVNPSTGSSGSIALAKWGTTAGTLGSPTSSPTTLTVTGPGGRLEALTQFSGPLWGGYMNATNFETTSSVTGIFDVPSTSYNTSANTDGYAQHIAFWVGFGGWVDATIGTTVGEYFWQAGIDIAYDSSGAGPTYTPWYLYNSPSCLPSSCPEVNGPSGFTISIGDTIEVTVTACGPMTVPNPCLSSWQDTWSIVDETQTETWSGTLSISGNQNLPVDTNTSEWIGEAPAFSSCNQGNDRCDMPVLTNGFSFTSLDLDGKTVHLFGPYEAAEGVWPHSGPFNQYLVPSLVADPSKGSFSLQE